MATATTGKTQGRTKRAGQLALGGEDNRRAEIEAELNAKGVRWSYQAATPLDAFDVQRSLRNQARVFKQLDEKVVDRYAAAVTRGDIFPPVVAHRPGGASKLINVDGNHRLAAFQQAEQPAIDTYIIHDADPQTIVMMTFEANSRHGLPTDEEERVHQAVWLMDAGASARQAAGAVGVSEKAVRKYWAKIQVDRRADECGIDRRQWDTFSQWNRKRLASVTTDEGFRALTNLAFRANLNAEEIGAIVTELNQSRSGSKHEAIVKHYADIYADRIAASGGGTVGGHTRKTQTPKQRFLLAMGQMMSLPDNITSMREQFADQERAEAAKKARTASARLAELADALER